MNLLQVYGILLLIIYTASCLFFMREYIRRGGSILRAIKCGLAMAAALLPMGWVVLLYAGGVVWPSKVVWFTYACSVTGYVVWAIMQDITSQRGNTKRLIKSFRKAPLAASVAWFGVLVITLPSYMILWIYAT